MDLGVSHTFGHQLRVGTVLPSYSVAYYEVPAEYGVSGYHCTFVNDGPGLVEPGSRHIIEIIDLGVLRRTSRR